MDYEHDPQSTDAESAGSESTDAERAEREAQSEDPTSPKRGFEDVEQHDEEQEES
jgi:hypothetical protein